MMDSKTSCTLLPKCNVSTNSKQTWKQTLRLRSTDWKSSLNSKWSMITTYEKPLCVQCCAKVMQFAKMMLIRKISHSQIFAGSKFRFHRQNFSEFSSTFVLRWFQAFRNSDEISNEISNEQSTKVIEILVSAATHNKPLSSFRKAM